MDLIEQFPGELQRTVDLMVEKEIRLRTPLEELQLLMEAKGGQGEELQEDGGEMGEEQQAIPRGLGEGIKEGEGGGGLGEVQGEAQGLVGQEEKVEDIPLPS